MECPKCRANNSDDAVCCSLCLENFKPKAASVAAAPLSPPAEITVKLYGLIDMTKGGYLLLQLFAFGSIVISLLGLYSAPDAVLGARLPPDFPYSVASVRRWSKVAMFVGLAYQCVEAWVVLGMFKAKREKEALREKTPSSLHA